MIFMKFFIIPVLLLSYCILLQSLGFYSWAIIENLCTNIFKGKNYIAGGFKKLKSKREKC